MLWNWQTATVEYIQQAAPKTYRFGLRINNATNFAFKAGQFITLDLPISTKRLQRWRSYSIASPPQGDNLIELCVVQMENGLGSTYLCEQIKEGDSLTFKGADGNFVLPEVLPEKIVMIATGTGIAPFRSMIRHILNQNTSSSLHLVFGTRFAESILYADEWQKLADTYPNFRFSVALSREETPNTTYGYVHKIYTADFDSAAHYYICGWKAMIDEACANLKQLGLPDKQLHYELYG